MNSSSSILEQLITLSKQDFWECVDAILPAHANDIDVIAWAKENTKNPNANLKDLSACIFETSTIVLEKSDIEKLLVMIHEQIDNSYPRFRAACAFAKRAHVLDKHIVEEARAILREHLNDEDVADIAKAYLGI
ncbi:MAG: hypothetical protein HGB03_03380 [Candidatus Yonathbacteria bacterium]|nr:hypothetical protein [Candidatus Yonathbacteria bacterium]NTW47330.1 hypothetical protein [Candidatus Yonathbacteria bacterium]